MLVQPLATRSIRITIANMANRESHFFHCKTTPGPDKVTTTITLHTSAARSLSALVTSAATRIFVLDHCFRNACTRNPNIPSQLTIRSKMATEMKTTNRKQLTKQCFRLGPCFPKGEFPIYTCLKMLILTAFCPRADAPLRPTHALDSAFGETLKTPSAPRDIARISAGPSRAPNK